MSSNPTPEKPAYVNVPGIRACATFARYGRTVVIAPPGLEPTVANVTLRRGGLCVTMPFDRGVTWFDRMGFTMARFALDTGHAVRLVFANEADAAAMAVRLEGGE